MLAERFSMRSLVFGVVDRPGNDRQRIARGDHGAVFVAHTLRADAHPIAIQARASGLAQPAVHIQRERALRVDQPGLVHAQPGLGAHQANLARVHAAQRRHVQRKSWRNTRGCS